MSGTWQLKNTGSSHKLSKCSTYSQAFSWCSWLSHPPNTRKVSGSNPDENKFFFTQKFDRKINYNLPNCRFLVDVCNGIRSGSSDAGDNDDAVALRRVVLKD